MAETAEDELLELIYATALDPSLWPAAMEKVADRLGGARANLTAFNVQTGRGEQYAARADPAALEAYAEYYHTTNVFPRRRDPEVFLRGWRPNVATESDVVPWEDYQKSEFCNDYVQPQDYNAQLFIRLQLDGEVATTLNIGRPLARGRFEAADLELANGLLPHLVRAYRLGRSFSSALGISRDLALSVENGAEPMILVDAARRVRLTNPGAERLCVPDSGLTLAGGQLAAEQPDASRQLERLVGLATAREGPRVGGAMRVAAASRRRPLAVRIAPIGLHAHPILGREGLALVTITDLEADVVAPEDTLRDLFGLTSAESRLAAAVFDGLTLPEAAERFGVTNNTVRTQLAHVFDKTGVSRQAELVKLMMRLAGAAAR